MFKLRYHFFKATNSRIAIPAGRQIQIAKFRRLGSHSVFLEKRKGKTLSFVLPFLKNKNS